MHYMRMAGACALALAVFCVPGAAQIVVGPGGGGGPMQLPPAAQQMKTGTARVKGRIVTADGGAPVRRAQVRISGPEIMAKTAMTDSEGRYEFGELPAGRYTISATKSGFVTINYGQTRPNEAGKPIELRDAQVIERADITMPKGSAIAGRIVDEFGEPIADVSVSALRSTWSNGKRRLQPAGRSATTNDLGQYRIYGLSPGEYYVSASSRGPQELMVAEMAMTARLAIAGGPSGGPETPRSGYAPTYYPGTPSGAQAQRLSLAVGQEAQNTDFSLVPIRLVSVKGTVIGSEGRPLAGVMVSATPREAAESGFATLSGSARSDQNGNFTISGIAPGDYTLNARSSMTMTSTDGNRTTMFVTRTIDGPGGAGDSQEFGSTPLSVGSDDISNVMIVTTKGTSASGKVTWEGGAPPKANMLRISAASPDQDGPMAMLGGSSSVTAEGTFEIRGLAGPRVFRVSNVPAGWILKAILLNGTDITDTGTDIRGSEPVSGLEVVLTSKLTEVTGTVKAGNDPAIDYTVVVFSDDPQKWTVPMTRHIASARPNQEGTFQVRNLPAGGYYVIALDYIAQGDWFDPEVLDRLKAKATKFTLDDGETERLDLKLQGNQL